MLLQVKSLKKIMEANSLPTAGCFERADMVAVIVRAKEEATAAASRGGGGGGGGGCGSAKSHECSLS